MKKGLVSVETGIGLTSFSLKYLVALANSLFEASNSPVRVNSSSAYSAEFGRLDLIGGFGDSIVSSLEPF